MSASSESSRKLSILVNTNAGKNPQGNEKPEVSNTRIISSSREYGRMEPEYNIPAATGRGSRKSIK